LWRIACNPCESCSICSASMFRFIQAPMAGASSGRGSWRLGFRETQAGSVVRLLAAVARAGDRTVGAYSCV
jgi:hypothetical protein